MGTVGAASEEWLVRRVAEGDTAAFEELYRRTSPWLAVRLRRRCADDEIVAEVMQETYLAVWRAAAAFAGTAVGGSALGWLWTIAARRLVDAYRRRAREAEPPPAAFTPEVLPAAEDEALRGTVGDEMGAALRRLAPELQAGAAGDGARRAVGPGDRGAARPAGGNGQDPGPAGPDRAAGGAVMKHDEVPAELLERYAAGDPEIDPDEVWAVEAHLEGCAVCRDRLGAAVRRHSPATTALLARVGGRLAAEIALSPTMPRRRRAPVLGRRGGCPARAARRLAMTVVLVLAALASTWSTSKVAASSRRWCCCSRRWPRCSAWRRRGRAAWTRRTSWSWRARAPGCIWCCGGHWPRWSWSSRPWPRGLGGGRRAGPLAAALSGVHRRGPGARRGRRADPRRDRPGRGWAIGVVAPSLLTATSPVLLDAGQRCRPGRRSRPSSQSCLRSAGDAYTGLRSGR